MDTLINKINEYFKNNDNDNVNLINCKGMLEEYKSDDWKNHIKFSESCSYSRNMIYRNDNFDIYLICWNKQAETPIHDHADNGCLLKVLNGKLSEIIYDNEMNDIKTNLEQDNIGYMHNSIGTHKVINVNNDISHSLHIYSPPNYICKKN